MVVSAACGQAQNSEISILEIMEQWTAIEHAFMGEKVSGENNFNFEEIDALSGSLNAFLNSETYRIFRLAPLLSETDRILGPSEPNEIPEISAAAALLLEFRKALSKGETEKALLASSDVTRNLVMALARSTEAERYAHTAYFRLLLVFIAFIIITALLSLILSRAIASSIKREAYGSWFSHSALIRKVRDICDYLVPPDFRFQGIENA